MSWAAWEVAIGWAVLMGGLGLIALFCWEWVLRHRLKWLPWQPSRRWVISARVVYWSLFTVWLAVGFFTLRNVFLGNVPPQAFMQTVMLGVGFFIVVWLVRGFVRRWSQLR